MSRNNRLAKILVICGARIPSAELYAIIPLSELQKRGLCKFKYKDEASLSQAEINWCDILFIVRGSSDYAVQVAQKAKDYGRIVLGCWDDNLLCIPSYSINYSYFASQRVRENLATLFKLTDAFFSPNTKLVEKLSELHGKGAKLLPIVMGSEKFKKPEYRKHTTPILGFGGGIDHIKLLNSLLGPAILDLANAQNNFKLHVIGPEPDFINRLPFKMIYTPHISNYYAYQKLASKLEWDIGLAPQMNTEFTTYKTYVKFLEYTYVGCAGIYTNLEPYTLVIKDGVNGLLVENEITSWRDGIKRLLNDPNLEFRIKKNAYDFCTTYYNRSRLLGEYLQVFEPYLDFRAPKIRGQNVFVGDLTFIKKHGIVGYFRAIIKPVIALPGIYPLYLRAQPFFDFIFSRKRHK